MRWIPYTFLRITFFFLAGIVIAIYFPNVIPVRLAVPAIITLLIVYVALFVCRKWVALPMYVFALTAFPGIFLSGYVHLHYQTENLSDLHFSKEKNSVTEYVITITGYPEEKDRSWKVAGEISTIKAHKYKPATGKVLLYFTKTDFLKSFRYGDKLLIRGAPQEVPPPGNPGEFNYKQFLAFKNIYHQQFPRKRDVQYIGNDPPSLIKFHAIKARDWAKGVLYEFVSGDDERGIAAALVLGVTDGLDNELLNAYAATGAMHVLAVSGLHISIIYIIILWLLSPLNKKRYGKWIIAGVSLIVLWAYAFVTGLSPSVLRAVTMFTFMAVATATSRNTNIYNTLAASAFCLLMYDPFLIMSVGFQLSYIAVVGIVYLQPYLYQLWEPRGWLLHNIWKITCVSLAAQVATFAMGMLYFHQFPNYFLVSNLLVIPASFGVLIFGLLLLAVSFITVAAKVIGFLLMLNIKLMNFFVVMVELLPYSLVENIHISTPQCWLLMFAILFFILMMQFRNYPYFLAGVLCMGVFSVLQWHHYVERRGTSKIAVYKVPGHSAIDFFTETKAYFISDSALYDDLNKIRFHIRPNRLLSGVDDVFHGPDFNFTMSINGGRTMVWRNKRILHITARDFHLPGDFDPHVVVVANNAIDDLTRLTDTFKNSVFVFDSSNSFYYVKKKIGEAQKLKVTVHSVLHEGAFEMSL
jgi:competence protein ComEC